MKRGKEKIWTCPHCKRQFERQGQPHSCRVYPLQLHFLGKPAGRTLYELLKKAVKGQVGSFKTESLECCIHWVSTFTFAAVRIMKHKIRVSFSLGRKIKSSRVHDCVQTSANRYICSVDVSSGEEIDDALMKWIQEASELKSLKAEPV